MKGGDGMKRLISFLLLLTLMGGWLAGCGGGEGASTSVSSEAPAPPPEPTAYPVTVAEVELATSPERVVSLSPALTALLADMGYADRLVGRASTDAMDGTIEALPDCGTPLEPAVETLLELAPALILSQAELPSLERRTLEAAGIQLLILPVLRDLAGMETVYGQLGLIFEGALVGEETGAAAARAFEDRLGAIAAVIAGETPAIPDSATAPVETSEDTAEAAVPEEDGTASAAEDATDAAEEEDPADDEDPAEIDHTEAAVEPVSVLLLTDMAPAAATPDTLEGELMALAGLRNAAAAQTGYQITLETIAELDPDLLVVPEPVTIPDLEGMEVYQALTSVLDDRVLAVDPTTLESGGMPAYATLLAMAEAAYPELDFSALRAELPDAFRETASDGTEDEAEAD